jgi:ketosteroid isomerase-like protein
MSVRETIERGDFDEIASLLSPDVVWVGLEPGQLCRNRDEVLSVFREALASGMTGSLEVVAEEDDLLVIAPHVTPPPERNPDLHQVFVVREERIVELRDFRDRAGALEAVGLS